MNTEKTTKTAYPLYWPLARPRTESYSRRTSNRFQTSFAAARDACIEEIRMMGGSETIISTNIKLRRDGIPQSADFGKALADPGVAVYFTRKQKEMCFACDAWNHVQDNMHAINLTIAALRGIARWGTGDMMEAAFAGFRALPAPGQSSALQWWKVLGVPINASAAQVLEAYRILAAKHHPDKGGDAEMFHRIREARDAFNLIQRQAVEGRAA